LVSYLDENPKSLVLEGGNLQAIEKSDFFKKSDFFAFKLEISALLY
jgi:hypothetical protein